MNVKVGLITILLSFLMPPAFADGLPKLPKDMEWYDSKNNVGTFSKPKTWFVKEESKDGTNALFISRENIDRSKGRFIAGFSVNKIVAFKKMNNIDPSIYAKSFIQNIEDEFEVLISDVVKGGPSDMNIARVRGKNNGAPIIVHHIAIGMDESDILYLISFEAPESEWDSLYKYAKPMLNFLLLSH